MQGVQGETECHRVNWVPETDTLSRNVKRALEEETGERDGYDAVLQVLLRLPQDTLLAAAGNTGHQPLEMALKFVSLFVNGVSMAWGILVPPTGKEPMSLKWKQGLMRG